MKTYSTILRTLLLGAIGSGYFACSSDPDTCEDCSDKGGPGDGDGDTGDGDTGDGDGDGDGDESSSRCTNPRALENGFVACDEGYTHRTASVACPNVLPREGTIEWPESSGGAGGAGSYTTSTDECSRDADCDDREYCAVEQTNGPYYYTCEGLPPSGDVPDYARTCHSVGSGCVTDADCAADQYCKCGELSGSCALVSPIAGCRTDADCAEEALCVSNALNSSFDSPQLACQLEGDECETDRECAAYEYCRLSLETGRACQEMEVCGRPFLVRGAALLAPLARGSNWPSDVGGLILPEDESVRSALAEHFWRVGAMEHASIAAFARFTLQLLSIGAPAEFVEASNAAQVDETRHARATFALASAYAGEPIGPGPLPLDGALEQMGFEAIFEATVLEGCIGETRAALEAQWAAEGCRDPLVRQILQMIARDESRHAELAWRVAAWMIEQRPALAFEMERLLREAGQSPHAGDSRPEGALKWGILSDAELQKCWGEAFREILVPCSRALCRAGAGSARVSPAQSTQLS